MREWRAVVKILGGYLVLNTNNLDIFMLYIVLCETTQCERVSMSKETGNQATNQVSAFVYNIYTKLCMCELYDTCGSI